MQQRVSYIRLRVNEATAMDLLEVLGDAKTTRVIEKAQKREQGKDVSTLRGTLKRLTYLLNQLRSEMVLVEWLPEEAAPMPEPRYGKESTVGHNGTAGTIVRDSRALGRVQGQGGNTAEGLREESGH